MRTRILLRKTSSSHSTALTKKRTTRKERHNGGIFAYGEYILTLRLESKLSDLRVGYANSHLAAQDEFKSDHHNEKNADNHKGYLRFFGRSGGTRTRGLQYPKLARYQLRYTSF